MVQEKLDAGVRAVEGLVQEVQGAEALAQAQPGRWEFRQARSSAGHSMTVTLTELLRSAGANNILSAQRLASFNLLIPRPCQEFFNWYHYEVINRPGVVGAVPQTPL